MIVCSMPGCQTTAGCQCHLRFPYYPPQAPTLTTGGTGANLSDFAAGRLAGLREAAEAARGCQTFDWKGGDEWAAGYADGKNAAADRILALAGGEG